MAIEQTIYSTATLLGVMREQESPSDYWLSLAFPTTMTFETEWIEFEKVTTQRKLAPLVVPMAQGRPIYTEASHVARVKPAYVKPKDPVSLTRILKRRPGNLSGPNGGTPQSRYNAIIADIMAAHRDAIERRWEWLAAQAIIYGEVTLEDEDYPETLVDFNRAAGHTVILTGGTQWGEAGVSILDDIAAWRQTVIAAKFGGMTTRMTMGSEAWALMKADDEIRELLKQDFRPFNAGLNINLGADAPMGGQNNAQRVGTIDGTLELWVYADYYQGLNGEVIPFMDPRDVVLTGPNIRGVRCFGAILDSDANFQPMEIFPKMWKNQDPSVTYCMSQSAPLMVPVNPNNTFRARVVE